MARKLMVDPPQGWRYGFPKYIDEQEGIKLLDMIIDDLTDWLLDRGYPMALRDQAGWCRFMWIDTEDN